MPWVVTSPPLPVVERLPDLTNLSEHQISGTAEPFATVVAMVNQEEVGQFDVMEDGTFSGMLELDNGINRVSFKCFDTSLNPSGSTEAMLVQVDLNPPHVTSTIPPPDQEEVPITDMISLMVSESLVESSVSGRLELAGTGTSVPATVTYSTHTKTITVVPQTSLEKGTTYRVVVDGTDPAGNHLTGGLLSFTTTRPEEPEPSLGGSMLIAIIVVVLIVVVLALVIAMRMRKPPAVHHEEQPSWEEEPTARTDTDQGTPIPEETYEGSEWDEY